MKLGPEVGTFTPPRKTGSICRTTPAFGRLETGTPTIEKTRTKPAPCMFLAT